MHPADGTYEFTDADGTTPLRLRQLGYTHSAADTITAASDVLARVGGLAPCDHEAHAAFAVTVGALLERMLSGERVLDVLRALGTPAGRHTVEPEKP